MENASYQRESKKRAAIYLLFVLGMCFVLGVFAFVSKDKENGAAFSLLQKGFTAFPILAALFTRLLTKDKSSWNIDLRVWKNRKMLMLSALLPGAAVLMGAGIYYIFFPNELHGNAQSLHDLFTSYGMRTGVAVSTGTIIRAAIGIWLVSVLAIPLQLIELGEEAGWRGYLLPQFLKFMSVKKSVILNGVLWGVAHYPLIFFGFNYGHGYWGAPYSGIAMFTIVCISLGIWMSYVMIKTKNCMYTAILHGAINVAGDIQTASVAVSHPLLGPTPAGIIGFSVILVISVILFFKLPKSESCC